MSNIRYIVKVKNATGQPSLPREASRYHAAVPATLARCFVLLLLVFAAALAVPAPAGRAQPSVPATYYGTVARAGESVPEGTEVRALIDGNDCTQDGSNFRNTVEVDGVSQYSIEVVHESQEPGCGAEGREVTFTVAGEPAGQSVTWEPGPQRLDLTVGGGSPVAPPSPSRIASPGAQGSATATAGSDDRPTGTPPLDDVDLDDVLGSGNAQQAPGASAGSDEDGSALPWLIAIGACLAAAGASIGWYLARRKNHHAHRS